MDTIEDSENNAKVSDSGYSHSCSYSQSRSSKSTHSGSNSSGSSGYGGKPASCYGTKSSIISNQAPDKRKKEKCPKKKKSSLTADINNECKVETTVPETKQTFGNPQEEKANAVAPDTCAAPSQFENQVNEMEISDSEKNSFKVETASVSTCNNNSVACVSSRLNPSNNSQDRFSCVISLHDGVVMYVTESVTTSLDYPKEMWIGRSFIDFIHPKDRDALASLITNGLAVPKTTNGIQKKAIAAAATHPTMVCRIRRYRGLVAGYGIKDASLSYMPFLIKLSFKNVSQDESQLTYLVLHSTPFFSAFKTPNEMVNKSTPFVIRHAANGNLEYIDPESVPYLGYLPQDVINTDALLLYHPEDLPYLKHIYETIVREGSAPRCKFYRMLTQNGGFTKVETEWSSFINPWSKKLEFVIGKHFIIEGPLEPDVFLSPANNECVNLTENEKKVVQMHRESILRTLSDVLTKPAEKAKQQMTNRCQDLASFMESLMEELPKEEEQLCLEMQDPDNSLFERDSVMFGGISPHYENDSKSSTETPLSYNRLNYNETLHRYFECHQQFVNGDGTPTDQAGCKDQKSSLSYRMNSSSPTWGLATEPTQNLMASNANNVDGASNNEIVPLGDHQSYGLTAFLLTKHNLDMEKELLKKHRDHRAASKPDKEKIFSENWHKNTEHLARCSEPFLQAPETSLSAMEAESQPHGVKRSIKQLESDALSNKQHCSSLRQLKRKQTLGAGIPPAHTSTTLAEEQKPQWAPNNVSSMNTFIYGVGLPPQMPMIRPVSTVPGVYPLYYASTHLGTTMPPSTVNASTFLNKNTTPFHAPISVPCMMYGQAVYGSPLMYSTLTPPLGYNMQQNSTPTPDVSKPLTSLGLSSSNYKEVCKSNTYVKPSKHILNLWQNRKRNETIAVYTTDQGSSYSNQSNTAMKRVAGVAATTTSSGGSLHKLKTHRNLSDNTIDRTDGESSFSSFYSSFFKTESGSADDSSDAKKTASLKMPTDSLTGYLMPQPATKSAKRKMYPPWLDQVCVTPNLMYKYQVEKKNMDEVLSADKQKMNYLEQPSLVNEQLGQLYLDLHLEGVAARLTLEEGITSSSSSGEDSGPKTLKVINKTRRRRECSKLVMIYEEDAPFPPPPAENKEPQPSTSKD